MMCLRLNWAAAAVLAVCCCLNVAGALNFIVVPMPSDNSPVLDLMAVAAELQSRGHNVYVVADDHSKTFAKLAAARHSSNTTAEAMQYIHVSPDAAVSLDDLVAEAAPAMKSSFQQSRLAGLKLLFHLQKFLVKPCKALLADAATMQQLKALEADAVMAMAIPNPVSDGCNCALSHALGGVPWVDVYGNPMVYGPLSVPQMSSGNTLKDLWTLKGFAKNLASYTVLRVMPVLIELFGNPWAEARRHLGLPPVRSAVPGVNALSWVLGRKRDSCTPVVQTLLNSWLIEYPRPLAPNQVLVGPGTPRPAHPIANPEVATFVDSAPAGVVLMAVGTTPQAKIVFSAADMVELAKGFALLAPTRVLWALKPHKHLPAGMKLENLPLSDNIMLTPWVDYNDVLGHPNIRALVSHCGWHTVYEAAYHGVPVVGVPFQVEQSENTLKLINHGMAVLMPNAPASRHGQNVTFQQQAVADTIKKVMDDRSYSLAAQGISVALQTYSKRRQPYARAADEIELAIYTLHAQQGRHHRQQQQQSMDKKGAKAGHETGSGGGQHQQEEL